MTSTTPDPSDATREFVLGAALLLGGIGIAAVNPLLDAVMPDAGLREDVVGDERLSRRGLQRARWDDVDPFAR